MPSIDVQKARFNMIEQQIRPWNVLDTAVLELLASVRRDAFVADAHKALAYADLEIPLPGGQCMLAPRLEARRRRPRQRSRHPASPGPRHVPVPLRDLQRPARRPGDLLRRPLRRVLPSDQ